MIQAKEKSCKGTGKAKSFGCNKPQLKRTYGLGHQCGCYSKWLLETEEGRKVISSRRIKASVKVSKDIKKETAKKNREQKEKNTNWKSKLQDKINEISRLIDIGQPCLARGYHPNQVHAGHIFSRGSTPSLKFNLHNIHRQSAQSNHFQNEDGLLREGLINEYGQDYFNFLSELRRCEALKFSNEEYHSFHKKASVISKQLKSAGKVNDLTERINLRNKINLEMGIYIEEYCIFK